MKFFRNGIALSLVSLALLFLNACITDSDSNKGLPQGHYFLGTDSDDYYNYSSYQVVLSNSEIQFVEYGRNDAGIICQLTRHKMNYQLIDNNSKMKMISSREGGTIEKCGITKQDFDSIQFSESVKRTEPPVEIQNITANSFEIKEEGQWQTYTLTKDPTGFFE